MARPPVYEDGLFELSIDPSENSLNNTFKKQLSDPLLTITKASRTSRLSNLYYSTFRDSSLFGKLFCDILGKVLRNFPQFVKLNRVAVLGVAE
jgi:hypothetical protein